MSKIAERIAKLSPDRQQLLARLLKQDQIDLSQSVIMPRVRNSNHAPLSFAQQRLWLVLELDPDNIAYNIPEAFLVKGRLDASVLARSVTEIFRRHEIRRLRHVCCDQITRRRKNVGSRIFPWRT